MEDVGFFGVEHFEGAFGGEVFDVVVDFVGSHVAVAFDVAVEYSVALGFAGGEVADLDEAAEVVFVVAASEGFGADADGLDAGSGDVVAGDDDFAIWVVVVLAVPLAVGFEDELFVFFFGHADFFELGGDGEGSFFVAFLAGFAAVFFDGDEGFAFGPVGVADVVVHVEGDFDGGEFHGFGP